MLLKVALTMPLKRFVECGELQNKPTALPPNLPTPFLGCSSSRTILWSKRAFVWCVCGVWWWRSGCFSSSLHSF